MYIKNNMASTVVLAIVLTGMLSACDRQAQDPFTRAKQLDAKGDISATVIELKNALQREPNNAKVRLYLGELYARIGLGLEAEKELQRAASLGVTRDQLAIPLARAYLLQGKHRQLLKEITVPRDAPPTAAARIEEVRGHAQLRLGNYNDACALFAAAREHDPKYASAHWGLARCAAIKRDLDGARAHLTKATEVDPNNSESWALLGELERVAKHYAQAETAFSKSLALRPNYALALMGRAAARIDARKLDEAMADVQSLLKVRSKHPVSQHLRGVVLFHQGKPKEAAGAFEAALTLAPNYPPSVLWLGLSNVALGNMGQATAQLSAYTKAVPNAVEVKSLLAVLQASRGGSKEAAQTLASLQGASIDDTRSLVRLGGASILIGDLAAGTDYLQQAVQKSPEAAPPRVALASALMRGGQIDSALEQLQKALQLDPKADQAQLMLVRGYAKQKKYDEALQAARGFAQQEPMNPLPPTLIGIIELLRAQRPQAQASFEAALKLRPGYPLASHSLARMALDAGQPQQARALYEQTLKAFPEHLETLLAMYQLELGAKRDSEAQALLQRALDKHPTHPIPATLMGRRLLAAEQIDKALLVTQAAAAAHPSDANLLELRGRAYLHKRNVDNAIAHFKQLVAVVPNSADAQFRLGVALLQGGDVPGMRDALQRALRLQPRHLQAKVALARLEARQGDRQQARMLADELKIEARNASYGWLVEAELLAQAKDYTQAAKVLQAARDKFPSDTQVLFALVDNLVGSGQMPVAIEHVTKWRQEHPNDARASALLAQLRTIGGDDAAAAREYEAMLKTRPDDASVMNNLAWSLRQSDPKRALALAKQAYETMPESAGIADTYGWLTLQAGDSKSALDLLAKALRLAPKSLDIRYHYAAALAKNGNKESAKRELTELTAPGRKFAALDEARALLVSLQ